MPLSGPKGNGVAGVMMGTVLCGWRLSGQGRKLGEEPGHLGGARRWSVGKPQPGVSSRAQRPWTGDPFKLAMWGSHGSVGAGE